MVKNTPVTVSATHGARDGRPQAERCKFGVCQQRACTRSTAIYIYPRVHHRTQESVVMEASHKNFQVIVKNGHTFDDKNAADFIEWYENIHFSFNSYGKVTFRVLQGVPVPSAATDTDGSKLATWNTANEDLYNVLLCTTKGAACSVIRRFAGNTLNEGSEREQRPWAALRERFDGCSTETLRVEHANMNSVRMSSGQDPDKFPYKLDTHRERLNARNPLEETIDRKFEGIILQALPPKYECIRTPYLEKPDFWIADIHRMMSAIYAANHARSSSSTSIAGHGAAMPATKNNRRDIIFSYCERADHFKNTCLHRAKHEQQRQEREQRNEQQNQQQCGRRQRGRQRRRKTSRQPPSYREKWCSYRSTTNHSDADCRAVRTQTATPT